VRYAGVDLVGIEPTTGLG